MNTLLPIIRRARRPLYPPDDPAPAVPPAVVEPPPVGPMVDETPAVVSTESVSTEPVAPVVTKPKKAKRGANAPT